MIWIQVGILVLGFVVLMKSAQSAIKRVIRLSHYARLSEFFISFLIIGIISTLPELSIGINSALLGQSSLGLGIVFGSNIADLTLVMGIVALFSNGIRLQRKVLNESRNVFFLLVAPLLLMVDGTLSRIDGVLLIVLFAWYVYTVYASNLHEAPANKSQASEKPLLDLMVLVGSIILLFFSGNWISNAAESISLTWGLPILFIGILVALGTCLPELMVALQAAQTGHSELGFGDIMGNVCADSTLILGAISIVQPIEPNVPLLAIASGGFIVLALVILLWLFYVKKELTQKEGVYLILLYLVFLLANVLVERALVPAGAP